VREIFYLTTVPVDIYGRWQKTETRVRSCGGMTLTVDNLRTRRQTCHSRTFFPPETATRIGLESNPAHRGDWRLTLYGKTKFIAVCYKDLRKSNATLGTMPCLKSHNTQSNTMHCIVPSYFILQYLVDQSYVFRSVMGSASGIHTKVNISQN
jgi:hypothetical protein